LIHEALSLQKEAAMRRGREAIVKTAIRVFALKGYAGASVREICHEAGVTKPVLYYHFQSKKHLYQELMVDSFSSYQKRLLSAARTRGTMRERLVRMIWTDFLSTKEDPLRKMFILRMVFSIGEQQSLFDFITEMEKERRLVSAVLQEGIDAGNLQGNALELATIMLGMPLIATLEHLFIGRPPLTRRRAEKCIDLLLQGCVVR
jgi:AcrR family transcriptional regulator